MKDGFVGQRNDYFAKEYIMLKSSKRVTRIQSPTAKTFRMGVEDIVKKSLIGLVLILGCHALHAHARGDVIEFNPDMGRLGEPMPVDDPTAFRVCADKDNMPFTNENQEGFENKIAELIADDLGQKLQYYFGYDRFGFIRTSLNAHMCDVMIGTVTGNDMLSTTKPYYRTSYVFVYRKSRHLNITDWDSPDLKNAKIGVVDMAPATRPLDDQGLMGNLVGYPMMHDPENPPSKMIDDLVSGKIDVAVTWGPVAGYFAQKDAPDDLVIVPCPEYSQVNEHGKESWNISVGVRKKDKERLAQIQDVLQRRQADIMKILDEYHIPHLPLEVKANLGAK
jgi:mxaJ protein